MVWIIYHLASEWATTSAEDLEHFLYSISLYFPKEQVQPTNALTHQPSVEYTAFSSKVLCDRFDNATINSHYDGFEGAWAS